MYETNLKLKETGTHESLETVNSAISITFSYPKLDSTQGVWTIIRVGPLGMLDV